MENGLIFWRAVSTELEYDIFSKKIIYEMKDMLSYALRQKISIQVKSDADDVLGEIVANKFIEYIFIEKYVKWVKRD